MPKPREEKGVRLSMTGEEFKTLIERFTENGQIDTVPELMRSAEEMPALIEEKVQDAVDNIDVADDSDIEELFDNPIQQPQDEEQPPVINDSDGDGLNDDEVASDDDIENLFR